MSVGTEVTEFNALAGAPSNTCSAVSLLQVQTPKQVVAPPPSEEDIILAKLIPMTLPFGDRPFETNEEGVVLHCIGSAHFEKALLFMYTLEEGADVDTVWLPNEID